MTPDTATALARAERDTLRRGIRSGAWSGPLSARLLDAAAHREPTEPLVAAALRALASRTRT